ncbi:Fic family protein [Nostoc sp. C117]|uniref:Fic family protein n=1 Tax=Nostoc sp. C117 TaxID=3349875 RepID=UPI00370DDAAD
MLTQKIPQSFNWEYKDYPQYSVILEEQSYELLKQLWSRTIDIKKSLIDTRDIHRHFFKDLTPFGHEYFAGNYRGENYPLLYNYEVGIPGNLSVGCPSKNVPKYMVQFGNSIDRALNALDVLHESEEPLHKKLIQTVSFSCAAFIKLTNIHPYANGNGHMGRFLLISSLINYGYKPKNWTIHPRPLDPPYTTLIRLYENGDKESLHKYILQQIPIP